MIKEQKELCGGKSKQRHEFVNKQFRRWIWRLNGYYKIKKHLKTKSQSIKRMKK